MNTTKSSKTYFFEDKPLFGLDISYDTLQVMQLAADSKVSRVLGYGSAKFDPRAIVNGVIVKPELLAKAAQQLFQNNLVGQIDSDRVAIALPSRWALTRAVQLPRMSTKDIEDAVKTEVEQYIPISTDNLYVDYTPLREDEDGIEVFVVTIPKKIVDSYLVLTRMLGLEAVLLDLSIGASAQIFAKDNKGNIPSVLIDFGAEATDVTIFNHGLVVTGSVAFGGEDVTAMIAKALHVTRDEAIMIKNKYGLSASILQKRILNIMEPSLELLIKEIRRTIRYYEQRYAKEPPIGQIVTMAGGMNIIGLVDFLTDRLRLPARTFDLTTHLEFDHLLRSHTSDHMSYVTAAGLALTNPAEIFS